MQSLLLLSVLVCLVSGSIATLLPEEFDPRKPDHPWSQLGCLRPIQSQVWLPIYC